MTVSPDAEGCSCRRPPGCPCGCVSPAALNVLARRFLCDEWADDRVAHERPTKGFMKPQAFGWFWAAALSCEDEELDDLVAVVPPGVKLAPAAVLALADELAGPSRPGRGPAHAALLRKLHLAHAENLDLATLIASAPLADPHVLLAALELLSAAGHPSRTALIAAATDAARRSVQHRQYALTVCASLLPFAEPLKVAALALLSADGSSRSRVTPVESQQPRSVDRDRE